MRITLALASALVGFAVSFADSGFAQQRIPYRVKLEKSCSGGSCYVESATIAAKRRIELENFSCATQVRNGSLFVFRIETDPAPSFFHYPAFHWLRTVGTFQYIHYSEPTGLFATAGQRFSVQVNSTGDITQVSCFL